MKKQPQPDTDRGEELKNLCAMNKGAEEQPPVFREDAISMYLARAVACKTPVTITPKRKRREDADDAMDGKEHQEEEGERQRQE